jgi:hypothetical protein
VIRWAQAIEQYGSLGAYLEHYQQAKKGPCRKRKRKMGTNGIVEVESVETLIRTLASASPEEVIAKLPPFLKME